MAECSTHSPPGRAVGVNLTLIQSRVVFKWHHPLTNLGEVSPLDCDGQVQQATVVERHCSRACPLDTCISFQGSCPWM